MGDCVREAREDSGIDAIRVNTIAGTNPDELTDAQRLEWYEFFRREDRQVRYACMALWSEEITEENADKRNEQYERCVEWVKERPRKEIEGNDADSSDAAAWLDTIVLLERPYLSLTTAERFALRHEIDGNSDCRRYYPQLFTARWIPLFDE